MTCQGAEYVSRRLTEFAVFLRPMIGRALAFCTIALLAVTGVMPMRAQTPEEQMAFDAAIRTLESGFAEKAAKDLAEFVTLYPSSPLAAEATLLEARARSEIGQLDGAAKVLEARLDGLGARKEEALYLLGDVNLRRRQYPAAAEAFHRLIVDFPESRLLLRASFSQALATFQAGDAATAAALLGNPTQAFARAAANAVNDESAIRGHLLLAQAQMRAGDPKSAEDTLRSLSERPLTPEQAWNRQWLETSLLITNKNPDAALASFTNLYALSTNSASPDLLARSHTLRADILRRIGRTADAFALLTNNLAAGVPAVWRRDALLAIAELSLNRPQVPNAIGYLAPLAAGPPTDPTAAAARVATAELTLQSYFGSQSNRPTNALPVARNLLNSVITNSPGGSLEGRAWLSMGWTELASDQLAPATEAFSRASSMLPHGSLQALAIFKLADCYQRAGQNPTALTNYLRLVNQFGSDLSIRGAVMERALYQGTLAAIEAGQPDVANELARRAVLEFPNGEFRDDTRILYGQTLARLAPAPGATDILRRLSAQLTNSPALPEIQLAVARSYIRDGSWSNAVLQLDDWTRSYPTHARISAAEFERAWAVFKSGDDVRAYPLFTNFLARFPESPTAPQAQTWVGNYLARQGNYVAAETSYQLVFQQTNWPVTRLTFEARLLAGRAAFLRQGYKDATNYFGWLIAHGPPAVTNSPVPPELVAQAYFALGDCFLQNPEGDDKLGFAMTAFTRLIETFPKTREALLARGKLADCHLQRAALDPSQAAVACTNAALLYLEVMKEAPDPATRSEAEVGLGIVREKQAALHSKPESATLLSDALAHHVNVFTGRNLKPGETGSPFWINRAGIEGARLAEAMGLREQAAFLLEKLAETFPAAATAFRQRAAQLRSK